jgi:hypothetical protein
MFFVGATGQLLTLILTVCLPFVFLFSAQPNTEILNDTLLFNKFEIKQQITSFEYNSIEFQNDTIINETVNWPLPEMSLVKDYHCKKFREKWKSINLKSSGNKAPPAFDCSAC